MDHAYEAPAISHPDGRVTGCLACERRPEGARVASVRAADLRFLRERLLRSPGTAGLPRLDPSRVAVVGHSMGGAAAFEALRTDAGFAAAANLDGTVHTAGKNPVTGRSCCSARADTAAPAPTPPGGGPGGPVRSAPLAVGARRGAPLLHRLRPAPGADRSGRPEVTLGAADAQRITRELVVAYLDERLRQHGPRLDTAVRHAPEVVDHGR